MSGDPRSETDWIQVAYAEGADARRAGKPETDNPYDRDPEWQQHRAWKAGWHEVDVNAASAGG